MFKVDLSNKVVAITGAGGIICSEFAKELASMAAKLTEHSEDLLKAIKFFRLNKEDDTIKAIEYKA